MSSENKELQPILVLNPETKRHLNIAPLMDMVNEMYMGEFHELANQIDEAAVNIACCVDEMDAAPNSNSAALYLLFRLRDTLNCVAEFKEERRH